MLLILAQLMVRPPPLLFSSLLLSWITTTDTSTISFHLSPFTTQGLYFLSTLVQLRTSFPPPLTHPDVTVNVNLFSTLPEYEVFGTVFDGSFLVTAVLSAVVRWVNQRINSVHVGGYVTHS